MRSNVWGVRNDEINRSYRVKPTSDRARIVVAEAYPRIDGAQRSLLELYGTWQREGRYELHFVYFTRGELADAVDDLGIESTQLDPGPLLSSYNKRLLNLRWWEYARLARELVRYSGQLKKLLLRWRTDLFHCNTDRSCMMSLLGARRAGCPMVTHIRRDRSFGWRDRVVYRGSQELIWVSNRVRDEFSQRIGVSRPKGRVIYNGRTLPDRDGPNSGQEVRKEFALPSNAKLVLMVAGYNPCKDHETLVKVAQIACEQEQRLYFLLAGLDSTPGEERLHKIKGLIEAAGLSRRVLCLGHRRDVPRLLRGVDLLINPSKEEALGGALIEAIGYGVPCIATDTGGSSEIVSDGECGYLAPRRDHETLARRVVELLHDDQTRSSFSRNARKRFDDHFAATHCARETAAFFDDILMRYPKH